MLPVTLSPMPDPDLSIVVPVYEEEASLPELADRIQADRKSVV